MRLDFFKDIFVNKVRNNEATRFLEELNKEKTEPSILDKLVQERKVSIQSRNTIRNKETKIIEEDKNNLSKEEINEKIIKMANEVLDRQDEKLKEFRKEEHLYMVEEDKNGKIFLTDITGEENNIVLEEVDFPKELIKQATEGTVFRYKDGTYHFYSRDGFERIYGE